MKIYFNDLSLDSGILEDNFQTSIKQVIELIKILELDLKENLYADVTDVIKWKNEQNHEEYLKGEALEEVTLLLNNLQKDHVIQVEKKTYFELYYIQSKNPLIRNTFVGDSFFVQVWADKIQQEEILIINIPDEEYSQRSFIPIFLNKKEGYEYQNFSCLNIDELDKIKVYVYSMTKIKRILKEDKKDKIGEIMTLWNQHLSKEKQVWNLTFDSKSKTETLFPLGQVSDWVVTNTEENPDVAKKKKLAEIIAFINGWKQNPRLTRINNRDVYEPKNKFQGNILYIATDTQHGEFEVHHHQSKQNNHLGAISFDRKEFKDIEKKRKLII